MRKELERGNSDVRNEWISKVAEQMLTEIAATFSSPY